MGESSYIYDDLTNQIYLALKSGFVNSGIKSSEDMRPRLLTNDFSKKNKVLSFLAKELESCDTFMFSVAFITDSGFTVLLKSFKDLKNKGVRGRILTSDYLTYNSPKVYKRLLDLNEIFDVRIYEGAFHAKGYIFQRGKEVNIIVGSSNLTQEALTRNLEWNIKISSINKGAFTKDIINEYEEIWLKATPLTSDWIGAYEEKYYQSKVITVTKTINAINQQGIKLNKMQREALESLEKLREKGKNKALLISATGIGKTYLSAFDALYFKPEKFLFIIHRENVARRALESYKRVIGSNIKADILSGNNKPDMNKIGYLFATIQTLSKDEYLYSFEPDFFDYIVIDEVHRAVAATYNKIINYFKPKFMLGMTATPERNDDFDIFKLFYYTIAYEIRLQHAMQYDLLCPFHYFGISEISVDGQVIDDYTEFNNLTSEERVEHIIKNINYYGYSGDRVKGLVFCSRNEEAKELSRQFNARGYNTVALSGNSSEDERSRPTQSSIIFIQQLGRELRKAEGKEFTFL